MSLAQVQSSTKLEDDVQEQSRREFPKLRVLSRSYLPRVLPRTTLFAFAFASAHRAPAQAIELVTRR